MWSTKSIAAALLLASNLGDWVNANKTLESESVDITTVGITTVTIYSSVSTPIATIVTFTPEINTPVPTPTASGVSGVTVWTITGSGTSSVIPVISSTLFVNVSAAGNITTLVIDTAAPTLNLTSATPIDSPAPISDHTKSTSAPSEGRSASKATGAKNAAAAADAVLVVRRSIKAMAFGFLLALAL
ncbi:hypothetical protein QBC38DRAFT_280363 [Podospora fimiseda]|uniref:Uncharacterized protein n=1 Tax=Podospora fimiseda TaxID=252190 RepID=A0AAN7BKP8_9PEZI|nr:hypothetical protein QBC38DRAFT_280363 [Podospora fimiseda]